MECGIYKEPKISTIHGVHILNLTSECPTANTPTHLFVRNPQLVDYAELISLPLIAQAKGWIKNLDQMLDTLEISEAFEIIQMEAPGPISIGDFRERLQNHTLYEFKAVMVYLQYIMVFVGLITLVVFSWLILKKHISLSSLCCCCPAAFRITWIGKANAPPKYEGAPENEPLADTTQRPQLPLRDIRDPV